MTLAGGPSLEERIAIDLADGRFHSGQAMADAHGVSRAAIWKAVRALEARGVDVHAVAGKGYRLARPVEWLDRERLLAAMGALAKDRTEELELLRSTESTNRELLAGPAPCSGRGRVCLAEFQTRGRGRHGRPWYSPPGAGLCLSIAWRFDLPPPRLSSLSLAAGVAVACALDAKHHRLGLKWPNDLVWRGGKIGGILTELTGEAAGATTAIVGVGINHRLPSRLAAETALAGGLEPADLHQVLGDRLPGRNRLAARLIEALLDAFVRFEREGFLPFAQSWRELDVLQGRDVTLTHRDRTVPGIARGIDMSGALLFEGVDGLVRVHAGDVCLRPAT